ncbi:MAG TPA: ABC transporter substrate-binding protein [Candidatus Thermoplasmatota archaeon]|nr:ABC transporter substrate-binding protein [Candidatus Thermoplasmatota archaeon]
MARVASFVPTGTEWMYALGLEDRLVAVTYECDVPSRAKREKPLAIVPQDDTGRGYRVDPAVLAAARPDVLLTQSLCDVCAASRAQVEDAKRALGHAPRLLELSPGRLDDIPPHAREVAAAAGAPGAGDALARSLADRIDAVRRAVRALPRPRVVALEWTDPPMATGHWIPDMLDAAGAHVVP